MKAALTMNAARSCLPVRPLPLVVFTAFLPISRARECSPVSALDSVPESPSNSAEKRENPTT